MTRDAIIADAVLLCSFEALHSAIKACNGGLLWRYDAVAAQNKNSGCTTANDVEVEKLGRGLCFFVILPCRSCRKRQRICWMMSSMGWMTNLSKQLNKWTQNAYLYLFICSIWINSTAPRSTNIAMVKHDVIGTFRENVVKQ